MYNVVHMLHFSCILGRAYMTVERECSNAGGASESIQASHINRLINLVDQPQSNNAFQLA